MLTLLESGNTLDAEEEAEDELAAEEEALLKAPGKGAADSQPVGASF
eukprot:SAG22_NODE_29_length_28404_cov_23.294153_12_plen_47_part_00